MNSYSVRFGRMVASARRRCIRRHLLAASLGGVEGTEWEMATTLRGGIQMKVVFPVLIVLFLVVTSSAWSDTAFAVGDASEEFSESAAGHLREAEQLLSAGDKWRACGEYARAWQMARAEETRDLETAVQAAGPYCRLLFHFSLLDPLWWVADEGLTLGRQFENPSPAVNRSIGWLHYWVLMRDRVLGEVESGHEHALEAFRIADAVGDADLRAWTRLERSRLFILPQDAISAEVEILRCRAEPLYKTDIDYRSQCELRMEETHLAVGRFDHAALVVEKFLEGEEGGHHYKTESFYLLGKALREADEKVRAVWPLCLGKWLHQEHGQWYYHCVINFNQLIEARSPDEILQLLELARGYGPRDATAAIDLEMASRFGDREAGLEARERILEVTPEAVSPIMWETILRYRLCLQREPEETARTYVSLVRQNSGNYQRQKLLVYEAQVQVGGAEADFLETLRPDIPECLYRSCRMDRHWQKKEYDQAVEEARRFIESSRDPSLYTKYPYLRIVTPYQHIVAHTYCILAPFLAGDMAGMEAAIDTLVRDALDPVIVQRTFNRLAEHSILREEHEVRLGLFNRALAIEHSPVQRNRALVGKASAVRALSRPRQAEDIYRTVIADDAYLETGAYSIAEAHLCLAAMLRDEGRQGDAISIYQTMIAAREDLGEAVAAGYLELARLYMAMKALDEAEKVADAGIEWLQGKGTHAYYRLHLLEGHLLAARGEREAAIEVFRGFCSDRWPDWVRAEARNWLEWHKIPVP